MMSEFLLYVIISCFIINIYDCTFIKDEVSSTHTPSQNISTILNNSFEISSSDMNAKLRSCTIYLPYNAKYVVTSTHRLDCFENERVCMSLSYDNKCVIKVINTARQDEGLWKCILSWELDNKTHCKEYIYFVSVAAGNDEDNFLLVQSVSTLSGVLSLVMFLLYKYFRYVQSDPSEQIECTGSSCLQKQIENTTSSRL